MTLKATFSKDILSEINSSLHRFISRVLNASDVVSNELLDEDEAAAEEQERPRDGVLYMS